MCEKREVAASEGHNPRKNRMFKWRENMTEKGGRSKERPLDRGKEYETGNMKLLCSGLPDVMVARFIPCRMGSLITQDEF